MKKQFTILRGEFRSNVRSVAGKLLRAVPLRADRLAAGTNARGPGELRRFSFSLLALLAVAQLAQAQTNRPSGSVMAWGSNYYGVTNVPVAAQSGVVAIAAARTPYGHIMALKNDGSVVAWGEYGSGQTNVPVAAQSGVVAIAAGAQHSVALKSDGTVVAWGGNSLGQVTGIPTTTSPYTAVAAPVTLGGQVLTGVVAIAAGAAHTVVLKDDGTVVAWGDNLYGQVTGFRPSGAPRSAVAAPVTLGGQVLSGVTAIAAGGAHTMAVKNDGYVVAWGWNHYGQTAVPAAARSGVVAIAAGIGHSVALKNDGSIVAWGNNDCGETSVPGDAQSGVVAITAGGPTPGGGKTLALKNDGSIVAWGCYQPIPPDLPPALAIAAGGNFTVALVREPALLTLLRNADQTVSLSWSGAGVLEQTESLTAPNWQPAPSQDNPQTNSITAAMLFYRVKAQ